MAQCHIYTMFKGASQKGNVQLRKAWTELRLEKVLIEQVRLFFNENKWFQLLLPFSLSLFFFACSNDQSNENSWKFSENLTEFTNLHTKKGGGWYAIFTPSSLLKKIKKINGGGYKLKS